MLFKKSAMQYSLQDGAEKTFRSDLKNKIFWLIQFLAMIVQTQFLLNSKTQGLRLGIAARNANTTKKTIQKISCDIYCDLVSL